ncbi:MAG: hypothetical protein KKC64_11870, partial [Spirochaetes bacterium]|nr:hypothetical protein [Spirochaetota bacterium]
RGVRIVNINLPDTVVGMDRIANEDIEAEIEAVTADITGETIVGNDLVQTEQQDNLLDDETADAAEDQDETSAEEPESED